MKHLSYSRNETPHLRNDLCEKKLSIWIWADRKRRLKIILHLWHWNLLPLQYQCDDTLLAEHESHSSHLNFYCILQLLGTPEIGGLTSIQGIEIVRGCHGLNIVGGDLVEVRIIFFHLGYYEWPAWKRITLTQNFYPLAPMSDQDIISPNYINTVSTIQMMRI